METSQKSRKKPKQAAGAAGDKAPSRQESAPADKSPEPQPIKPLPAGIDRNTEDWIAEVSHELRLPIANIRLLVETLLDGALDDPVTARRMLSRAQTEVERLQTLVVNLLSIEQVSARREVQCEWVPLEPRVIYAIETTNKMATEKGVKIVLEIDRKSSVYANSPQLDQVLLNLVENAIKFTPEGGTVTVRSGAEPGCFSVSDTGIGMPAHEIPKIFQRFYRIDRAQSRGSTGLGLSIVKHIATLHGAKISVTSKEGCGSCFSLEFPGPRGSGTGSGGTR